MTKRILYTVTGTVAFLCLTAATAVYAHGASSAQDFVTKASVANEFEIESSKLALEKSQNKDVKSFAQRMVDDHNQAGDQLNQALQASHSGATPATTLDPKHQKLMEKLKAANGSAFNRQYISMQTTAHKQAVSLFSAYSKHGKDKALREFAAQTLPTLQSHLREIERIKNAR